MHTRRVKAACGSPPADIDRLLVPPANDYKLLTIWLLVNRSEGLSDQKSGSIKSIHASVLVYMQGRRRLLKSGPAMKNQ